MLVSFYKNNALMYATRNRYKNLDFEPFAQEQYSKILLGDGANTTLKTSIDNICDYVVIDGTRWFVTSYEFLNGAQVRLYLQRDVIGEFGINGMYGKVERGMTDTILRNKKELSVNQILKSRKPIFSDSNIHGNYEIKGYNGGILDNSKEAYGIMYFVKPSGLDPNTGEKYPDNINVNIPAFKPSLTPYPYINSGTNYYSNKRNAISNLTFVLRQSNYSFRIDIDTIQALASSGLTGINVERIEDNYSPYFGQVGFKKDGTATFVTASVGIALLRQFAYYLTNYIKTKGYFGILADFNAAGAPYEYNGEYIEKDGELYVYRKTEKTITYDAYNVNYTGIKAAIQEISDNFKFSGEYSNYVMDGIDVRDGDITYISSVDYTQTTYNLILATAEERGDLNITLYTNFIDEPYFILVVPLCDCSVYEGSTQKYNINKDYSFVVFNTVIEYLSGQNAYLVDAQIFPYCPKLEKVSSELQGIPFFTIKSSSYDIDSSIQLLPYSNVKKEYIARQYSIVSPDKSGKYDFNFYDYINRFESQEGISSEYNTAKLNLKIKVALKPFSIITSVVIVPYGDTLMNMTYDSDLRGCQPDCMGFECTLASNAFEEYQRANSNYQAIFDKQQDYLRLQQQTERQNELTQMTMSILSNTAMGAIAGAEAVGLFESAMPGAKAIGAGAVGAAAGIATGVAYSQQVKQNDKLREYEYNMQKELFDMNIAAIKNLPNSINRISSFNEIILREFYFVIETYECSNVELQMINSFIAKYAYALGVYDYFSNYTSNGTFIKGNIIQSELLVVLQNIANKELNGGIYYYGS